MEGEFVIADTIDWDIKNVECEKKKLIFFHRYSRSEFTADTLKFPPLNPWPGSEELVGLIGGDQYSGALLCASVIFLSSLINVSIAFFIDLHNNIHYVLQILINRWRNISNIFSS